MADRVQGVSSLSRKLRRLEVDGKTLKRALVAGALPVQNAIKVKAPFLTGNLRRSIHIGGEEDLNPDGVQVSETTLEPVPEPVVGRYDAAVYVGTNVEYAGPVEFGTQRRAAHPYMRPGFDRARGEAVREVTDALDELMRKAVA